MTAKLSIITPVYNTEAYLPACLDSILSQGFSDFEVLLVDGVRLFRPERSAAFL